MRENHSKLTQLLALLALTVFCICVLLVLLTSASVYQKLVEKGETAYLCRTAAGYLRTRVRQAQTVRLESFDGIEALVLEETLEGETYVTRVYCQGGFLRELYTVPGAASAAEDGEPILKLEYVSFSMDGNLLTVMLEEEKLLLYLPKKMEVSL